MSTKTIRIVLDGQLYPKTVTIVDSDVAGTYDYPQDQLASGAYGRVYVITPEPPRPPMILKLVMNLPTKKDIDDFIAEVKMQEFLSTLDPPVCPKLYTWGLAQYVDKDGKEVKILNSVGSLVSIPTRGVLIMEKCAGEAFDYLNSLYVAYAGNKTDATYLALEAGILDYYTQVATILERLKDFQFNHRDLKSDNILYTLDAEWKPRYLLADFGLACMTIGEKKLSGAFYKVIDPPGECFLETRDLAQLIFESAKFVPTDKPLYTLVRILLSFTMKWNLPEGVKDIPCVFPDCGGVYPREWATSYEFFYIHRKLKTTPAGVLDAIQKYKTTRDAFFAENPLPPVEGSVPSQTQVARSPENIPPKYESSSGRTLVPGRSYDDMLIQEQKEKAAAQALGAGAGAGRKRRRTRRQKSSLRRKKTSSNPR